MTKIVIRKASKDIHKRSTSNAGTSSIVYNMLLEDYDPDAIEWIKSAHIEGPMLVPLESIDFSNRAEWEASQNTDHVDDFVDEIENKGYVKPILLVNEPNDKKLIIVDGHHRSLAYRKLKRDPMAYIATVGTVGGPWDDLHSEQHEGKIGSKQK